MAGTVRDGLRLLRTGNFSRLFAAYLITNTGSAMAPIAMAFGVLDLTGSTRTSAYVVAAPVVAQVIILMVGGALADRTSRQRIMVSADVLSALSQTLVASLFLTGAASVPLLIALMLVSGAAHAFHQPAAMGFIPQVVKAHELQAANALLGAARSSATMIGAALAGVLVAGFGAGVTLAIDAASFLVAGMLVASLRVRAQERTAPASILEDLRLGWREFFSHQWLWTIVFQFTILVMGYEALFALIGPAVARDSMNGAGDWGFIMACFGAGTISGGLVALRLRVQRPMLVATLMTLLWSPLPMLMAWHAPLLLLAAAGFVMGMTGQIFGVLWSTTLHTRIPSHLLSRVAAYDHLGSVAMAPVGVVVAGMLYEDIGATPTLWLIAAAIIVPTVLVLFVPDVRRLRATTAVTSPQSPAD
ncbi:MAG: MFS transporter [Pseudomonadales bacterium]|nr:MFS transporter [Pseudomonadales bacterium]